MSNYFTGDVECKLSDTVNSDNEPQRSIAFFYFNKELQKVASMTYEEVMEMLTIGTKEKNVEINFSDGVFGKVCFCEAGITVIIPNMWFYAWMFKVKKDEGSPKWLFETTTSYRDSLFFATASLSEILEIIGDKLKYLNYVLTNNSGAYLFINPREDVVKWALKNKDLIPFDVSNWESFEAFIEAYQSNPELGKLVLDTLKDSKKSE